MSMVASFGQGGLLEGDDRGLCFYNTLTVGDASLTVCQFKRSLQGAKYSLDRLTNRKPKNDTKARVLCLTKPMQIICNIVLGQF